MKKELTFSLEYWKDRAEFFEKHIEELREVRAEMKEYVNERLQNENDELKAILIKLTEAITAQLKNRTDEIIPNDGEASSYIKAYRARRILIDDLEMTVRSANCLRNEGIKTLGQLCRWSEADLLRIPNLGRRSLNEIKEILCSRGLTLKPDNRSN